MKFEMAFVLVSMVIASPIYSETAEHEHRIQVDGAGRSYLTVTPPGLPPGTVPLMIVLHGGTGNAAHSSRTMGMNEVAQSGHFIVAYPNGTSTALGEERRVWNSGSCCAVAARKNIDDVHFVRAMIQELIAQGGVDAKRVYVTGESNGAMLAYRLLCEAGDLFAAVVAVSGTLNVDRCSGGQSVALLDIHGSADLNVPYAGGAGAGLSHVPFRSIPETLRLVTDARHCSAPMRKTLPGGDEETSFACRAGAPVHAHLIKGGTHAWPASAPAEVWNFAKGFSR